MRFTTEQPKGVLPTLTATHREVAARGWAACRGVVRQDQFLALAYSFGTPIAPASRPLVQRLVAQPSATAPASTYSSRYGRSTFPFHTDLANWSTPPRWILLRNAGGRSNTPTLVWDPLAAMPSELRSALRTAAFRTRAHLKSFLCNALAYRGGVPVFRWDPEALHPVDVFSARTAQQLTEYVEAIGTVNASAMDWTEAGLAVVIDNWRVVHARPAVEDPHRVLERVLAI